MFNNPTRLIWREQGKAFTVEIQRWKFENGEYWWNLYIYIYERHKLFSAIEKATAKRGTNFNHELQHYLYNGCTHVRKQQGDKNKIVTIEIGTVYTPPGDIYTKYARIPSKVRVDAIRVLAYLKSKE